MQNAFLKFVVTIWTFKLFRREKTRWQHWPLPCHPPGWPPRQLPCPAPHHHIYRPEVNLHWPPWPTPCWPPPPRGWARFWYFTGILDSWCLIGIYWTHTFSWNNYGKVKPIDPLSQCDSGVKEEVVKRKKTISKRTAFSYLESCSTVLLFSINICEKVKTSL